MAFTCPRCGRTSHSPEDERQGYCGACHDWTNAPAGLTPEGVASWRATQLGVLAARERIESGIPVTFTCPRCGTSFLLPPGHRGVVLCPCSTAIFRGSDSSDCEAGRSFSGGSSGREDWEAGSDSMEWSPGDAEL